MAVPRQVAVLLVLLWAFLGLRRTQRALSLQGKKVPSDNEEKAEMAKVNACRVCQMYL